jgi:hypothetical protein
MFKDNIKHPHSRGKADLHFSAFRPVKSTYAEDETIHKIPPIINGMTNTGSNDGSVFSE